MPPPLDILRKGSAAPSLPRQCKGLFLHQEESASGMISEIHCTVLNGQKIAYTTTFCTYRCLGSISGKFCLGLIVSAHHCHFEGTHRAIFWQGYSDVAAPYCRDQSMTGKAETSYLLTRHRCEWIRCLSLSSMRIPSEDPKPSGTNCIPEKVHIMYILDFYTLQSFYLRIWHFFPFQQKDYEFLRKDRYI